MTIPESDSGISFSKFSVSRHLFQLYYDELHSFSTFFALNFDKSRLRLKMEDIPFSYLSVVMITSNEFHVERVNI
jgi:hypothetical protein